MNTITINLPDDVNISKFIDRINKDLTSMNKTRAENLKRVEKYNLSRGLATEKTCKKKNKVPLYNLRLTEENTYEVIKL